MKMRALVHASQLLTGAGVAGKDGRHIKDDDLDAIPDGALVYSVRETQGRVLPHKIIWIGKTADLPKRFAKIQKTNLRQKQAVMPGLVDCHTHIVFAGNRADEFAARCAGASYQKIAEKGGGILKTVRATREATEKQLETLAVERVKKSASYGVRTFEIKSGYGLDFKTELKILAVIQRLKKRFPEYTFSSTFLGAHAFPPEQSRADYLKELTDQMLPEVVRKKLADCCDVFIDAGYYTLEEGRAILVKARALGLKTRIHADELANTESAALAAEIASLSADHLLQISENGISKIAPSNTVAVLLPGTAFYLKAPHAPARKLIEAGACVALATDFNPGTCMCLSLPTIMTIAALYLGMSRSEIFSAVTYAGAKALGLQSRKGSLQVGKDADFAVLHFSSFEETYYRFSW
ncbi:imidazolonepropionase [Bdellovibrionota bacterium FG-2]